MTGFEERVFESVPTIPFQDPASDPFLTKDRSVLGSLDDDEDNFEDDDIDDLDLGEDQFDDEDDE